MSETTEICTIQGVEYTFIYLEQKRQVEIHSKGLLDKLEMQTRQSVQETLASLGIYTRIQEVLTQAENELMIRLKPAASLELRDKNGQLVQRLITNNFQGNVISKRTTGHQYTATISSAILKETEFEHKQQVCVKPFLDGSSLSFLVFESGDDYPQTTIQVKSTGTGVLTIPSVFGSMADADGHGIQWTAKSGELYGKTTIEVPQIEEQKPKTEFTSEIVHIKQQEMGDEEKSWNQERFQTYLPVENEIENLTEETDIELTFASLGGSLAIQYKFDTKQTAKTNAPHIKSIYFFGNDQPNIYLPNSLVYGLGWNNKTLKWFSKENKLVSICE